jgi:GTP-binding protein
VPVLVTSSATREGLDVLVALLLRSVPLVAAPAFDADEALEGIAEHAVFRPTPSRGFEVTRTGPGSFAVAGAGVERLVARYDLDNEDAMGHLERRLRGIGVIRALEAAGFQPGDDVEIAGVEFELDPSGS